MLKGENIICISSIDWDFLWQGHQEIMSTLAENNNRVLFIENTGVRFPTFKDFSRIKSRIKNWLKGIQGIRMEKDNLYIFSPIVLPFPYFRIAKWINHKLILSVLEKWLKIADFTNPILWIFLPTPLSLDIIESLSSKLTIYYCIDNFRVSSVAAQKIMRSEIALLKRAELVFVTSKGLYDYCRQYNNEVHIFPFAVNFRQFEQVKAGGYIPEELKGIKRPIIGYIGGVHKWIDLKLIKEIAQRYPDYSFVFVGPIQTDIASLMKLKNLYFLGKKEHKEVPYFIKHFDLGIIPYLISDYTNNVYPTKLNEYLAMGKPVVSTNLPEILNFNKTNDNLVMVGKTSDEFYECILKALRSHSEEVIKKRILAAEKNSWPVRIEHMSRLIEEAIESRAKKARDWQEAFMKIYKVAKRKLLKLSVIALTIYLLTFYTPFVWYLASPLRISQLPQEADAIVVFGGGVGESGRAGQGYEERVKYAVELYKQGYSRRIIFSSGYSYIFKEPEVMKAVAISLGVPQEAIILEESAKNTYENIKFTDEILEKEKWKKIMLVSSPYHMLRSSLTFKKITKERKIIYTPVPESLFYAHGKKDSHGKRIWKRINIEQIRAIVHEYLGIAYYWWKGWV